MAEILRHLPRSAGQMEQRGNSIVSDLAALPIKS
jgi:hypothetical protein